MISLHVGSIFDVRADAIVNPANSFLNHGGGLAHMIERRALSAGINAQTGRVRPERAAAVYAWHSDHAKAPLIATGNAYVTSAGVLPYKGVVHAVGPIWNGGDYCEHDLLQLTMESVLARCKDHDWNSVVVPAISCGIFGFPVEEAARLLVDVAEWFSGDVTFAVMADEHATAFKAAIG